MTKVAAPAGDGEEAAVRQVMRLRSSPVGGTAGSAGLLRSASSLTGWPARRWLVAALGSAVAALVIGVPTGIVETSLYTRMTPVLWWNYPVWAASALLIGLIAATYVARPGAAAAGSEGRTAGGGLLSTLAVGCPVCNKVVVGLLGSGGALTYWAPVQPALAAAGVALLLVTLLFRLRGERACPAPGSSEPATRLFSRRR